jgi:predicted nucleic acid-binding protein
MRVLVDTSVWVDYFNGHPSPHHFALRELIEGGATICTCGVVVAEVFQGLRRDAGRERLQELFRDLTLIQADGFDPYFRAAAIYRELRRRGRTIRSTIDCLIAVFAELGECSLLFRDRDLAVVLDSGVVAVAAFSVER